MSSSKHVVLDCALSETPQGLKNLLKINSYVLHIDLTDLIKLSFLIIFLELLFFSSLVMRKSVEGRDNSQNGQVLPFHLTFYVSTLQLMELLLIVMTHCSIGAGTSLGLVDRQEARVVAK